MGYLNLATERDGLSRFSVDNMIDEVARDCVLHLPLHKLPGEISFLSRDINRHVCTNYGSIWTPGGRYFDGTDDYISCGNNTALDITSALTVAFWVKHTTVATGQMYLTRQGEQWFLQHWPLTKVQFYLLGGVLGSGYVQLTTGILAAEKWYYIVGVYDGSIPSARIFLDGVERPVTLSGTMPASLSATTKNLWIGDYTPTEHVYLNGTLGEVHIYNRTLSPVEIQQNYLASRWRYQ